MDKAAEKRAAHKLMRSPFSELITCIIKMFIAYDIGDLAVSADCFYFYSSFCSELKKTTRRIIKMITASMHAASQIFIS